MCITKWGNTLAFLLYQCRYYQKEVKINSDFKVDNMKYDIRNAGLYIFCDSNFRNPFSISCSFIIASL